MKYKQIIQDLRSRGRDLTIEQQLASGVYPSLLLAASDALDESEKVRAALTAVVDCFAGDGAQMVLAKPGIELEKAIEQARALLKG